MTKQRLLISACLPFAAALGLGCAEASHAVNDAVTVEVGADSLKAVEIERSITLDAAGIPGCLDFSATLPSSNTTVSLSNSATGCTLSVEQPDLVLLDQDAIERAREEAGDFDTDGIRGATLELQSFDLSTPDGEPLALADHIDAITLIVDGEVLLDHVAASELQTGTPLSRELPTSLVEKLKTSLKANRAATADVAVSVWLQNDALSDLPDALDMRLVLQPKLQVNVVDAAL